MTSDDVRADARRLLQALGSLEAETEARKLRFQTIADAPSLIARLLAELDRLDTAKWSWASYQQTCRTLQAAPTETVEVAAQRVVAERDAANATLARIQAVAADVDSDLARHILNIIGGEA